VWRIGSAGLGVSGYSLISLLLLPSFHILHVYLDIICMIGAGVFRLCAYQRRDESPAECERSSPKAYLKRHGNLKVEVNRKST
jgi:hypothetical protein